MNKKNTIKKTAALLLGLSFALAGTAGCGFITTDNDADMAQVVAEVNIASYLENDKDVSFRDKAEELKTIVGYSGGGLNTTVLKRDLVSYFLNVGYTYVNNYGYSMKDTFEMLMDSLVSRKIIVQYAVAYYLSENADLTAEKCVAYIESEKTNAATDKEKALLDAHPEVSVLKYFLTEGGVESDVYEEAVYTLQKSINDSLDSVEKEIIAAEEETHDHGESKTTPKNVNTEKTDYIPVDSEGKIDYDIYTGRNTADSCGAYERVNGSKTSTRQRAYNQLLASLYSNNLVGKEEDTSDFKKLDYYYVELAAQLEQALITKYTEALDEEAYAALTAEYVSGKYDEIKASQEKEYTKDPTAFEKALDGLSDTSFVLYNPTKDVNGTNYGFVYNILLPFTKAQEQQYAEEKARAKSDSALYQYRAEILNNVVAKDQRASWFCEHEDENYAYQVGEKWYFFENQTGANANLDKYESLGQYAGNYAYNGTVTVGEDGKYECKPNVIANVNAFLTEMETYVATEAGVSVSGGKFGKYVTDGNYTLNAKGEFADYEEFIYYEGKAEVGTVTMDDYFLPDTAAYKAVAAVNELTFAYGTDPGMENTYMGYVVSPYKTSFVPEFECAAQYAIGKGAGTYVVCPSDYGWHIIYVSYVFGEGDVYAKGYVDAERETEGTFSYYFYEALKSKVSSSTTIEQNAILTEYNNDTCVNMYTKRYQDLLEIA